jgi:hypothetical protein
MVTKWPTIRKPDKNCGPASLDRFIQKKVLCIFITVKASKIGPFENWLNLSGFLMPFKQPDTN